MKTNTILHSILISSIFVCISIKVCSQAANNTCANAVTLTPKTTCTTSAPASSATGNLQKATAASTDGSISGACGGATTATTFDVWYKFTANTAYPGITITLPGSTNLVTSSTYVELLSGSCAGLSSLKCQNISSKLVPNSALTIGTVYYVRIYTIVQGTSNPAGKWDFDICIQTPPAHDDCSGAISLTPSTSCSNTASTLDLVTATTGLPAGCESAGVHYDGWYSFVAASTIYTITLSSLAGITNPEVQLYSGACGSLTSIQCGTTSIAGTGLTTGNTYFVRVSNVGSIPTSSTFNICITNPPANDECANSISLYSNTTCTNTSATLASATPSASIPSGCAAAGTYYDVWFTFAAANSSETITLSGMTGISSPAIQLYSGSCGALTSVACGTSTLTATGLTTGTVYYVRVSNVGSAATSTGNFNICITHPAPAASIIDYGKSYVNISKNSGGGTINPGDTLEIRATFVIKTGAAAQDSLAFMDTLHLGGGVRLVPGSIALRTNEGKVYKGFTDAISDDEGYYYTSGTDTVVRINFGSGSSASARGRLTNTSKPSVFGSTCIIMATYRVVVYANYGTTLNLAGGKITAKDATTGILKDLSFSSRNAIVYSSPGLCPNAISASNAIGGDFNGTFGTGTAQNRAASGSVLGYTYATFTTGNPQDYYYGVANNTSAGGTSFTTTTTWAKPDNSTPTHRVFNLWDITGDHTGAANPTKGNPPCDPTQPVSATNPCGYMLVVNSAYKTDTAFQYSVSNLCPNTYYEISAWLKNICYKCGCDSNGIASTAVGYIPSALNDSSGVQPNLTFDINGIDYYTTGNIVYGGLAPSTQTGSDSNNTWIKRGFTYLTGAAQTSLTLTIRNNAPGGGGNDWAMDDISLATCLPNMQYSPSLNPTTCNNNVLAINDTVRSYFSNYQYYKWQRSTNGGSTWSDIASASGTASPTWNGSSYEYITSYTIPNTATYVANNGDKYRVVTGTTSGSLSNVNCQVTDGVSQISLNVLDCNNPPPLSTYILSFNANATNRHANLYWTTNREDEQVQFEIERSTDGAQFSKIGAINGLHSLSEINRYSFADTLLPVKTFYRISLVNAANHKSYSRIIQLQYSSEFSVANVTSFFESAISLDVNVDRNSKIDVTLLNTSGHVVKLMTVNAYKGTNNFIIPALTSFSPGVYILQIRNNEKTVTVKAVKK